MCKSVPMIRASQAKKLSKFHPNAMLRGSPHMQTTGKNFPISRSTFPISTRCAVTTNKRRSSSRWRSPIAVRDAEAYHADGNCRTNECNSDTAQSLLPDVHGLTTQSHRSALAPLPGGRATAVTPGALARHVGALGDGLGSLNARPARIEYDSHGCHRVEEWVGC
jgi:hypothetical protein